MTALIIGYCISGLFLFLSFVGRGLLARRVAEADEEQLADLRRFTESTWTGAYLAVAAFLSAVGATFLLVRGHLIGIGWWGVAIVYALSVVGMRRRRTYVLDLIGDRGLDTRVHSSRNQRRLLLSRRFATIGVLAYVSTKVLEYAYPEPVPDGAGVAIGLVSIVALAAVAGWLAMRTLVYLALDEDKEAARRQGAN